MQPVSAAHGLTKALSFPVGSGITLAQTVQQINSSGGFENTVGQPWLKMFKVEPDFRNPFCTPMAIYQTVVPESANSSYLVFLVEGAKHIPANGKVPAFFAAAIGVYFGSSQDGGNLSHLGKYVSRTDEQPVANLLTKIDSSKQMQISLPPFITFRDPLSPFEGLVVESNVVATALHDGAQYLFQQLAPFDYESEASSDAFVSAMNALGLN